MYGVLSDLLSDKKGGAVFRCFSASHLFYVGLFLCLAVLLFLHLKNRPEDKKQKALSRLIDLAFGLYIADFFLMPFAYGAIDVEKLPFHVCTVMCVLCFLSRHSRRLAKYRKHFALLGFLSNLVYLFYPAGVMWHQVHPLSYRVIQCLLFHTAMSLYGFLSLAFDSPRFSRKSCFRDLGLLLFMNLWAILGNLLYTGEAHGQSLYFNWFFVLQDPFGILPKAAAPYIMPFLNTALFFTAELLVYALCFLLKNGRQKIKKRSNRN